MSLWNNWEFTFCCCLRVYFAANILMMLWCTTKTRNLLVSQWNFIGKVLVALSLVSPTIWERACVLVSNIYERIRLYPLMFSVMTKSITPNFHFRIRIFYSIKHNIISDHREIQLPTLHYIYLQLRTGNSRQGAKGLSERLVELAIIALKVIKIKDG